jgi:cytochrome P450
METTAGGLCFLLWEIVSRPEVLQTVMKELNDASTTWDDLDILKLEKLPYFNATVYEGLRCRRSLIF